MLEIRIDRKCYPDRGGRPQVALSGLNLTVQRGEFVCVVGPSGCTVRFSPDSATCGRPPRSG